MGKINVEESEGCKWNDVSKSDINDVKDVKGYQDTVQEESKVRVFLDVRKINFKKKK
jgi:hypothetical protein